MIFQLLLFLYVGESIHSSFEPVVASRLELCYCFRALVQFFLPATQKAGGNATYCRPAFLFNQKARKFTYTQLACISSIGQPNRLAGSSASPQQWGLNWQLPCNSTLLKNQHLSKHVHLKPMLFNGRKQHCLNSFWNRASLILNQQHVISFFFAYDHRNEELKRVYFFSPTKSSCFTTAFHQTQSLTGRSLVA